MDKVTITTIKNPFDQNDRDIERVEYIPKGSVKSYLVENGQISESDLVVSVNAGIVPFEKWDSFVINAGDYIAVCPVLGKSGKSKEIVSLIAGIALSVVSMGVGSVLSGGAFMGSTALSMGAWSWGGYLAALAVMAVGGMLISKMQPKLEMDTTQAATRYSWSPQPMAIGQGYPLNIIYGTVRPTPLILAQHVTDDGVNQFLNLLLCLGDGPVDSITNIRVNGNPIANYNCVAFYRYGYNEQTVIENFENTYAEQALSFELLRESTTTTFLWSKQETDGNAVEGLEIEFTFPLGLSHTNDEGTSEEGWVVLEAQYKRVIDEVWTNFFVKSIARTIKDTTTAAKRVVYTVMGLSASKYEVRVRCTAKSGYTTRDLNKVYWTMLSGIVDDPFTRPGKILLGIKALATSQLSGGIPTISCNVTRSTVYVWNPTANEYQAKPATNPAWAAYDLIHRAKLLNTPYWEFTKVFEGTTRNFKISTEFLTGLEPHYDWAAENVQQAFRDYDRLATATWNPGTSQFLIGVPAVRVGGSGVSTNLDPWLAGAGLTDGSFNITLNGVSQDIHINFRAIMEEITGGTIYTAGDMPLIAKIIQYSINAIGTGAFTDAEVTWISGSTCFRIRSGVGGSSSTVAPLTAAATGTDISGSSFMKMTAALSGSYTIGYNDTVALPTLSPTCTVFGAAKEKLIYQDFYNWATFCDSTVVTVASLTGVGNANSLINNEPDIHYDYPLPDGFTSYGRHGWRSVSNGSFRISVDGTANDITGLNFSGVANMIDVAMVIQTAIRAIGTGGYPLVTVEWLGANFKISSGQKIVASSISYLEAASSGFDISGEYMSCIEGAAVLTRPGLAINYIVDKTNDLWTSLKEFENCGRGKVVTKGTKFGCIFDAAGTAVQMFTMGNIIKDSFREEFLPMKDRANALEITFTNKDKDYQRDVISIYTDDYDTATDVKNPTQVTFDGIDNFAQAYSEGKYRLRLNKYLNRVIYFDADVDSIACQVGDIVNFQHDVPQWGLAGGRCVSCNPAATEITIDAVVTLEVGQAYTIMLRHPASDTLITRTIAADDDERADISVIPVTVSVGYATINYDWIYALGKTNIQTKPFRVTNITRSTKLRRKLTCLEYVAAIYDEATDPPVITYSELDPFDEVTNLATTTDTFTQRDGTVLSVIYANWRVPRAARSLKFSVYYALGIVSTPAPGSANWIKYSEGGEIGVTINSVAALQNYTVKVATVNDLGIESPGVVSSIYVSGKDAKPDNVTGLAYSIDSGNRTVIKLVWDKVANLDLHHYDVTVDVAGLDSVVYTAPDNNFTYNATHTGWRTIGFKVKAVDNSGNKSELDASVSFYHKNEPADVTGFAAVLNKYNYMQVDLYWDANADTDITEYIIYKDDANTAPLDANIIWRGKAIARTVNLENGIHTLKIYARNAAGFKSLNAATATFNIDFIPGNVTGLTATRDTTYRNRINLAWDGTAESYEHCYHFDITSEYQNAALDVTKDLTTAVFKALDSGSHYVFSLVAKNAFGTQTSATPGTASITTNFSPNNVEDFAAVVDNGKKAFTDSYIYTSMAKIDGTSAVMVAQNETDNKGEIIKLTGLDGIITAANTIDLISDGGSITASAVILVDSTSALVAYKATSGYGYVVKVSGLDGTPSIGSPVEFSDGSEITADISLALLGSDLIAISFANSYLGVGRVAKITGLSGSLVVSSSVEFSGNYAYYGKIIGIDATSIMAAYADFSDLSGTPKIVKITNFGSTPLPGSPVTITSATYVNFIAGLTGLSAVKINSTTALIAGSSSVKLLYAVKIHGLDGVLTYDEPVGYDADYGYTTPALALVNSTSALLMARDATHSEGVIFNIQGLDGTLSFGINKFRYNYLSQDATHATLITTSDTEAAIAFKNVVTGVCNIIRVENIDSLVIPTFSAVTAYLSWSDITDKFPGDFYTVEVGDINSDWWSALPWSGNYGPDTSAVTGLTARYNNIDGAASLKFFIRAIAAQAPELGAVYFSPTATEITVTF